MVKSNPETLETLIILRKTLVNALEKIPNDPLLRNYTGILRDFRDHACLLRDLTSSLQDACLKSHNPPGDSRSLGRKERLGLDDKSW